MKTVSCILSVRELQGSKITNFVNSVHTFETLFAN